MPFRLDELKSLAPGELDRHRLNAWLARWLPWALLSLGLIALVTALTLTEPLPRIDRILQDRAGAQILQSPSPEIVIVAIDERSLKAIGRWPWRRAPHAQVLRRIAADGPRCIGLDLLLTEPDPAYPQDDALLAGALADSGCVVLPMGRPVRDAQPQEELLPLPAFARAASALGHAHLSIDDDGIARSIFMREGFEGRLWPHFTLALEQAAAARADGTLRPGTPAPAPKTDPGPWTRRDQEMLVFTSGRPAFTTVSYIDVLNGLVPTHLFRQRYVLIGATATGLGDTISTPAGRMPGVQVFANLLQAQLEGRRVRVATPWQNLAYNLAPLLVALLGLMWLRPIAVATLICGLLVLRLGLYNAWPWAGIRFMPAAGFIGMLLVYPLWSLMRMSATLRYLRNSVQRINEAMLGMPSPPPLKLTGDFLDREMAIATAAAQRMRDLHRFVRDGVDHMADATLVLDRSGMVMIANIAAARHWDTPAPQLVGRDAHALLADLRWRTSGLPMLPPGRLRPHDVAPVLGEGQDANGRFLLLRCVPIFNASNQHFGWIIMLVDISTMRQAQSQRDEALRFISHDIREPSASILTALELARARPELLGGERLFERIERHARTGLAMADGFVNLARTEAQALQPKVLDLVALLEQVIDNAWVETRQRQLTVLLDTGPDDAPCIGDRGLLTRALTNVLGNALKYSPSGADLHCSVRTRGAWWAVAVRDEGPGIPLERQSQLFQPFQRLHGDTHPQVHGVGLGLLQVRTALQRHGGSVEIDSPPGAGCTVTLLLPRPDEAELETFTSTKESS